MRHLLDDFTQMARAGGPWWTDFSIDAPSSDGENENNFARASCRRGTAGSMNVGAADLVTSTLTFDDLDASTTGAHLPAPDQPPDRGQGPRSYENPGRLERERLSAMGSPVFHRGMDTEICWASLRSPQPTAGCTVGWGERSDVQQWRVRAEADGVREADSRHSPFLRKP